MKASFNICIAFVCFIVTGLSSSKLSAQQNSLQLWYKQPADASVRDVENGWQNDKEWLKALPVGNGFLGAMIFGDVNKERIQLNEKSLWSGSPDDNNNPKAASTLGEIRQLLFEGKYKEANKLIDETQVCKGVGSGNGNGANVPFGCYQTLGDLWFDFESSQPYSNYKKSLDLKRAVVTVTYEQNGVHFKREIFSSYPDKALIIRFTSDKKNAVSFIASLTRPEKFITRAQKDQLLMTGVLTNGKGGDGLHYAARLQAKATGGAVTYKDSTLTIKNADEVVLILTASTNYKLHYPDYHGDDPVITTAVQLKQAAAQPFTALLARHEKDYASLFNKTGLQLSGNLPDTVPTDILLKDPGNLHLYELYFQYGRYLLISSSRQGSLPANLQGLWANKIQTPWNCDYHANINIQMNYWPADVTNLSACFSPLTQLMQSLVQPGTQSASVQYKARGWCMGPITNIWGYTAPGEGAGWGMYVTAGGWLCQQLWDHYTYTLDNNYLKGIYPIMLKAAEFYTDWLVKDPVTGKLVSGPATSPENSFIAPDGFKGAMSMGPSHDQEIITEFFASVLKAAAILKDKNPALPAIDAALKNMAQPGIAKDGRLMEWMQEFKETEPTHRHVSHLYMLYPGTQINPTKTPGLASAARKTLELRSDNGTGWSLAWKVSFWARLLDGEHAYKLLQNLLRPIHNYSLDMSSEGGTYENLFCGHPPFQIDGNFGGTAGMAEMLLQSYAGEIHLLPAIPAAWATGTVSGLMARGNFEIGMKWSNSKITKAVIKSNHGGQCIVRSSVPLQLAGSSVTSIADDTGYIIKLDTEKSKTYELVERKS